MVNYKLILWLFKQLIKLKDLMDKMVLRVFWIKLMYVYIFQVGDTYENIH